MLIMSTYTMLIFKTHARTRSQIYIYRQKCYQNFPTYFFMLNYHQWILLNKTEEKKRIKIIIKKSVHHEKLIYNVMRTKVSKLNSFHEIEIKQSFSQFFPLFARTWTRISSLRYIYAFCIAAYRSEVDQKLIRDSGMLFLRVHTHTHRHMCTN